MKKENKLGLLLIAFLLFALALVGYMDTQDELRRLEHVTQKSK